MMDIKPRKIVLCGGVRTPFGHVAKSLSSLMPEDLMQIAIKGILSRTSLYPHAVDGVIVGWVGQGSHAPNIARISVLKAGLPEKAHAFTVQANCVSGLESICSAARHIVMGEGELYIAGGTESMSNFPYAIRGSRGLKALRSIETLKKMWPQLWELGEVLITDTTEEGLTDPVKNLNMAGTAEVCAQMYSISRQAQDHYASETFRRAAEAGKGGFYRTHVVPAAYDGHSYLDEDEYIKLRSGLVEKPEMFGKAPSLFDSSEFTIQHFYELYGNYILGKRYLEGKTSGSVTLFNSCPKSDGAAAVIVASEDRAKDLGLPIMAEIKSWAFWGNNPAYMGISPAFASALALERAKLDFKSLDIIELHEAFAATCLSIFKVGKEKYGHDWETLWKEGKLNPHGGSIPLGHPLAATGTRIVLSLMYSLQERPAAKYGLACACAAGGLGGAMVLEKVS